MPALVLNSIRLTEQGYYAEQPAMRRVAERAEDVLTFAAPKATLAADFSLGPYRVRPSTIAEILPWAEA